MLLASLLSRLHVKPHEKLDFIPDDDGQVRYGLCFSRFSINGD